MVESIDNFDHADFSSLSVSHSNHDTVAVLFQNKPDNNEVT